MELSIVIPCYNEVENIPKIQQELLPVAVELAQSRSVEIIFVDDGSADGTGQALKNTFSRGQESGVIIRVICHEKNRGLGGAIRTGLAAAEGEIIVTTDADGTYLFSEIPALLSYLTPEIDIVTASPYHPAGDVDGVPAYRLALSRSSSTLYRLIAGRQVHTYTALFRAYRRPVIQNVPFESNGFLAGTELLVNAMRMGYRVAEYPTVLHSRVFGESKAKLMRTIQAHLNFQVRVLLPWQPYGTVIQGTGQSVYLYKDGQKRLFPTAGIFLSHGYHWEQIVQVNDSYLASLPEGPALSYRDGTLLKGSDAPAYVIEHGQRRYIPSTHQFEKLGYRWKDIMTIPDTELMDIPPGPTLYETDIHPDGTLVKGTADPIYLLENGQKRWFPSPQVFMSWGYHWDRVVTISDEELARYPTGLPIIAQDSFYLKDIQEALRVNLRPDELPQDDNFLSKLPQFIEGVVDRIHLKELRHSGLSKKILKVVP
jgi:dolichol-phosphate mannosyltransferase